VPSVIEDLEARGLLAMSTEREALRAALDAAPLTFYVGFDPTAPSLHMGNLVQLLTARRLQQAGHRPLVLVGGATGLIGDPKATGERVLNSPEVVAGWVERIREQVGRFVDLDGPQGARVVDNLDWTADMGVIEFLRDVGKHFPVNRMLGREVVRSRLDGGISYTEFSYVLLQSMDYLELFRRHGCRLQSGGSDQWGNITAGVELVRRAEGAQVHAIATPLVTKADGTKFGKTESGTVWLDPQLTSPFAFHQFWINADDALVGGYLRIFTFRPVEEIDDLVKRSADDPGARLAQRVLADDVTTLVHGESEARAAAAAAAALFGGASLHDVPPATLDAALRETSHTEVHAGHELPRVVDLLVGTDLVDGRSAARRTIAEGGAYVNNERISEADARLQESDLLPGGWVVLRRGRRTLGGVHVRRS